MFCFEAVLTTQHWHARINSMRLAIRPEHCSQYTMWMTESSLHFRTPAKHHCESREDFIVIAGKTLFRFVIYPAKRILWVQRRHNCELRKETSPQKMAVKTKFIQNQMNKKNDYLRCWYLHIGRILVPNCLSVCVIIITKKTNSFLSVYSLYTCIYFISW